MEIVSVQFRKQTRDGAPPEYGGREYTYFSNVPLAEGETLMVPTKHGETAARVLKVGLSRSYIDERIMPYMKTIETLKKPEERNDSESSEVLS